MSYLRRRMLLIEKNRLRKSFITVILLYEIVLLLVLAVAVTDAYPAPVNASRKAFDLDGLAVRQTVVDCFGTYENAASIMKNSYNAQWDMVRRGFPDELANEGLRTAASAIIEFSKSENGLSFNALCIPESFYNQHFNSVTWAVLRSEALLNDMLSSVTDFHYMTTSVMPTVPAASATQDNSKAVGFASLTAECDKAATDVILDNVAALPDSLSTIYDLNRTLACNEITRIENLALSTASYTAEQLTEKVLKMAVSLIMMGVGSDNAWQLVKHNSALVGIYIRCNLADGEGLVIPASFLRVYEKTSLKLLSEVYSLGNGVTEVPAFSDAVFESVYRWQYRALAKYSAWGQADNIFQPGLKINGLEGYAFSIGVSNLQSAITANTALLQSSPVPLSRALAIPTSVRTITCDPDYVHVTPFWSYTDEEEECCQEIICNNILAMTTLYPTFLDCCEDCNQFDCSGENVSDPEYAIVSPGQGGGGGSTTILI